MDTPERLLLSGNEAIAQAARDAGVRMGVGYPGTPSTEILERFSELDGHAQWAPNEKVALEVAMGAAMGGGRALATMKHVGVNVAADVLFTAAYMGVDTGLVLVSADDPGMASSQNEQDNRRYGVAAGVPVLEPADSQEAYDLTITAFELSEQFKLPVMLRVTTRICHSKSIVRRRSVTQPSEPGLFVKDIPSRVMIPAYAKPAHRRLRKKLADLTAWGERSDLAVEHAGGGEFGIVTSGISTVHAREAASDADVLQLKLTHPLPMDRIRAFVERFGRVVVIEEGDPVLLDAIRAAGMSHVTGKDAMYRFGELNVPRVRRILAGDVTPEPAPPKGRPPQLCPGCPHRKAYELLRDRGCIVPGDIGCYSLGTLPPFEAMDTLLCMGAGITVGLGLRWTLPESEARRVVSVIGDSTFMHSGLTGIADMVYNRPPTGHIVMILDNSTTAMTGMQEHPGTGRLLDHSPAPHTVCFEDTCRAMGVENVVVVDPVEEPDRLVSALDEALGNGKTNVIVVRRPCILAVKRIRAFEAGVPASAGMRPTQGVWDASMSAEADTPTASVSTCDGKVTNIVFAGIGGQGVLTASDILAEVAFRAGLDVKKAEIHGMSQRGGSVSSDVRLGDGVLSPMVPDGEADFLVVLDETQIDNHRHVLAPDGVLIEPGDLDLDVLANKKSLNVAMLGVLSTHLPIEEDLWREVIHDSLAEKLHEVNDAAFALGRLAGKETT